VTTPTVQLNSGYQIPLLGLGTYNIAQQATQGLVEAALELGYRHFDGAAIYHNEAELGAAIRACGVDREEIFVTTKLWNDRHHYHDVLAAFEGSMKRLGLDYLDLYLIHWPVPRQGLAVEAWQALIELRQTGRVRSIGVSNFRTEDVTALIKATGVVPAVNQIEMHPRFQQTELRQWLADWGIVTQAWRPLGLGADLAEPVIQAIAADLEATAAQVVIRWLLQLGVPVFPKTNHIARLDENLGAVDLALSEDQMAQMAGISDAGRTGPDPALF